MMNTVSPPTTPGALPVRGSLSFLAIASLVLGILGFCSSGLAGIVGLILGITALITISKSNGQKRGKGLAIAGVICSALSSLIILFTIFTLGGSLLPSLTSAREAARGAMALNNVKMIGQAAILYSAGNDDLLPPVDDWVDVLLDQNFISGSTLIWPSADNDDRCFAINSGLEGIELSAVADPTRTIFFFEVAPGSPLAGGPDLLDLDPRYHRGYAVVFVDGHAEFIAADDFEDYVWEPN